jgi:hypothetical protein
LAVGGGVVVVVVAFVVVGGFVVLVVAGAFVAGAVVAVSSTLTGLGSPAVSVWQPASASPAAASMSTVKSRLRRANTARTLAARGEARLV